MLTIKTTITLFVTTVTFIKAFETTVTTISTFMTTLTTLITPNLNLGMSQDAEACAVMIGVVDFLDRPVMGFIRLHKSQMIDDMVEVQMKVRFVFVLLGPKNDNIDYLEIGRCIGTLMTNKDFHETAYKATDRRDLINSIATFTNKSLCLVLPVGNFDEDLLTPIVEWMQDTMKKKTSNTSSLSDIQIYDKSGQEVAKMSHKQSRDF